MSTLAKGACLRALPLLAFTAFLFVADHQPAAASAAPVAPPAAFAACAACHSVVPDQRRMGPNLSGVAGRKAGSLQGYAYSPALKNSGLTWNAANLDRWIANPKATVAGNKMPYTGMQDAARRKQIVDYLMTLK